MPVYPIVYFDCIVVKVRQDRRVINKSIYLALGDQPWTGNKELLGLWLAETEGAKFWLPVLTELQNRGLQDIFIACVDGLNGFPDAINAVFPKTRIQLCIVHMVRTLTELRVLEGPQGGGGRSQADLSLRLTVEEAERRRWPPLRRNGTPNTRHQSGLAPPLAHVSFALSTTRMRSAA